MIRYSNAISLAFYNSHCENTRFPGYDIFRPCAWEENYIMYICKQVNLKLLNRKI